MKLLSSEFVKSAAGITDFPKNDLPEIAFAGRSNVGKSSLINMLLGKKGLARTSSTPGRTQLINFFIINNNISFVDLPGYGYAKVSKEIKQTWQMMIEDYLKNRAGLKCVIIIMDIRRPPEEEEEMLFDFISSLGILTISVLTKIDKLSGNERARQLKLFKDKLNSRIIACSSVTGEGKDIVWRTISECLKQGRRLNV